MLSHLRHLFEDEFVSLGRNRTSAVMYGFIDGAVRSGERAATEVMKREAMTVA
jgi:hypothetical protein